MRLLRVGYYTLTATALVIGIVVGYNQLRIWQHNGQSYMSELLRVVLIFVFCGCVLGGGIFHYLGFRSAKKQSPKDGAPSEPPPMAPEPKLKIHRAVYAAGLLTEVSVTDELQKAAREGIVIAVDGGLGGLLSNDPALGVPKRLDVEYSYGSDTRFRISRCERPGEIVRLVLPEDSEIGRLTSALKVKDAECEERFRTLRQQATEDVLPVALVPTKGAGDKQFLVVTNKGQRQDFHAQCQLLEDFNGRRILRSYQLSWENGAIRGPLSRDESGNLVIAIAGQDRQNELNYIALQTMSGGRWERLEFERWNFGEKPTDIKFRLSITVIGEETQTSKSQDFIVRPGTSCALEMIPPESEPNPTSDLFSPLQLEAFQLARELRIFLKNMGPRPVVEISGEINTVENVRKVSEAVGPWLMRVVNTYRADFEDKVNKLVIRLAAENLRDFALDAATKMPNNEKTILDIAELLPLLAVKLDFADGRKALRRET